VPVGLVTLKRIDVVGQLDVLVSEPLLVVTEPDQPVAVKVPVTESVNFNVTVVV